ncbi:GL17199 [Drosophila persimilis]|uniref:Translin n=2 Tax=pseudoobscura subgroup TaxID=32358 RepID=A0A6I8VS33_DROPS|nr:translin [Drosophila persimilis]XP_033233870.1 translin [Drosophila pseudoobscura]EDW35484.1 GL17199 [Drosophila persimilis]
MTNFVNMDMFSNYQKYIDNEQELRENIRLVVREIEHLAKDAQIKLQIIHSDLSQISGACGSARKLIEACAEKYVKLATLVPPGQYYRYSDHWTYITQRLIFLIALVIYLEAGFLVTRETVAEMLGLKTKPGEGFHLDVEDYLLGILQLASELSRFATNSVTMGDYERPLNISHFIGDLNTGFRLLNLKNDGLRKRFDALKYDVKKIEEVVYDVSIRGLSNKDKDGEQSAAPVE